MFSKACEYGIRATIYIVKQSGRDIKLSLKVIALAIDSPEAYTSKILQQLARHNIINSTKGPNGGFFMEKEKIEKLNLRAIVFAIDGNGMFTACGLGIKDCNAKKPCPVHHHFLKIRNDLILMLETTTIQSLVDGLNEGTAFLKR